MSKNEKSETFIVTGGAGFIGSNLVHYLASLGHKSIVIDKLTYAGNKSSLDGVPPHKLVFYKGDICDTELMDWIICSNKPTAIFHLAAESHVDRSIDAPKAFIETNILGTYSLLQSARKYYLSRDREEQEKFRFIHVSTDEVYGSLGDEGYFTEETSYEPNSPYSASKASSDHLVRAWFHTFKFPTITTNCSNNYGPRQFPEKLIPLIIHNALAGKELPIYGDGKNVRDWLYVTDHCAALYKAFEGGRLGEVYNIGGNCEKQNIEVVKTICSILDELRPKDDGTKYDSQIRYVTDRPGHDRRYAIDSSKIMDELNWKPEEDFDSGIRKTISWYFDNEKWVDDITSGKYQCQRLGLGGKCDD